MKEQPMEFESLLEQIPEDLRDVVSTFYQTKEQEYIAAIEAEKERGIQSYRKKDQETLKLKNQLKSFESGSDETILREKTVAEQIKALQDQLEEERVTRSEAEKKIKNKTIEGELTKALGDKIYGAEDFIQLAVLRGDLQILDDQIVTSEGKPFSDYISNVLESKKGQLKVIQNPGVHMLPRQSNGLSGPRSFNSIEEINSLTPDEIKRHAKEIRAFLSNKK
jgi:hypothetical protein